MAPGSTSELARRRAYDMAPSPHSSAAASDPIRVVVRVRPQLDSKAQASSSSASSSSSTSHLMLPANTAKCVTVESETTLHFQPVGSSSKSSGLGNNTSKSFSFSSVLSQSSNNQDVFDAVKDYVIEGATKGFNASILAYGQTCSGKTHTMYGSSADEGVTQRTIHALFERLSAYDAIVTATTFEIYNEKAVDLINGRESLNVREDPERGPFLEGITAVRVDSAESALQVLSQALAARATAETKSNDRSSRSHAVFQLQVCVNHHRHGADSTPAKLSSKLSFVDLAGSERVAKSQAAGSRLKEANNINMSLSTLGLVINTLSASSTGATGGAQLHVPYRNSLLTWLLRDSLGGNSRTTMIATINPSATETDETLSTLRYADRAKSIVNHARENEEASSVIIRSLRREIDELRAKLPKASDKKARAGDEPAGVERSRFSMDALQVLGLPPTEAELHARVKAAETRADQAEKKLKAREEAFASSSAIWRTQFEELLVQTQEKHNEELQNIEENVILPQINWSAVLRIQLGWRQIQANRNARHLTRVFGDMIRDHRLEIENLRFEKQELEVEAMRHCRDKDVMAQDATRAEEEAKKAHNRVKEQSQAAIKLVEKAEVARSNAEARAENEARERQLALSEAQTLKALLAQHEQAQLAEQAERENAEQVSKELALRVEELSKQLADSTITAQDRRDKLENIARVESELAKARDAERELRDKNDLAKKEVETLRAQVATREKALCELRESVQVKRLAAEREASELKQRLQGLESTLNATESTQEERDRKIEELERVNRELIEREAEMRRLRESETAAMRERVRALEANANSVGEMERLNAEIRSRDAEARAKADREVNELEAKVRSLESALAGATENVSTEHARKVAQLSDLNRQLEARAKEEKERRARETNEIKLTVARLEQDLKAAKTMTQKEIEMRDQKLRELEILNVALVEAGMFNARHPPTKEANAGARASMSVVSTKKSRSAEGSTLNTSVNSNNSIIIHQQQPHSVAGNRSSIILHPNGMAGPTTTMIHETNVWHDNQVCLRVDVETFDEKSNTFRAVESSVEGGISSEHIYLLKSPVYDLQQSRWSRFVVSVVHRGDLKITNVHDVQLVHFGPGVSANVVHRLKVAKIDRTKSNSVVQFVCDWHNEKDDFAKQPCFCLNRTPDFCPSESGALALRFNVTVDASGLLGAEADTARVNRRWEFPMRFKHVSRSMPVFLDRILGGGSRGVLGSLSSERAFVNTAWFAVNVLGGADATATPVEDENNDGNRSYLAHAAPLSKPIRDASRVVAYAGTLGCKKAKRVADLVEKSTKVHNWFVFAPPFLISYKDRAKAGLDFSKTRVSPHAAALSCLRLEASSKIAVRGPAKGSKEQDFAGGGDVEFIVTLEGGRAWQFQAANREDMERWVGILNAWLRRERAAERSA